MNQITFRESNEITLTSILQSIWLKYTSNYTMKYITVRSYAGKYLKSNIYMIKINEWFSKS